MDMTKSDVCQFLTRGTKNAHCATCAFIPYAGFSQIRSHILTVDLMYLSVNIVNDYSVYSGSVIVYNI